MTKIQTVDALGLLCPLPTLRVAKVLRSSGSGEIVKLLADDPVAVVDVPNFCRELGHHLISVTAQERGHAFLIKAK